MTGVSTLIENYEEHLREVAGWTLKITVYQLGDKWVCIIDNMDPGATICRVSASARREAMKLGLETANNILSRTVMSDLTLDLSAPAPLSRLEYFEAGKREVYSVGEFLALPLQSRMQYILSGEIAYYGADGSLLQSAEAMRQLRKVCEKGTAVVSAA